MRIYGAIATSIAATLVLTACQSAAPPPIPLSMFKGFFRGMEDCRERYAEIDARVEEAGVRDGAFHRVPGYPYLRTDRLMASYADEIKDFNEIHGWLRRMRELDQEAREFEYINLGMPLKERATRRMWMQSCGKSLAALEIGTPEELQRVKDAIKLQDDYSSLRRSVGFYPLAVPLLKARLDDQRDAVRAQSRLPVEALESDHPLVLWRPQMQHADDTDLIPSSFDEAVTDELGVPGLTETGWVAMVEQNAPHFWIETAGEQDLLGAPGWQQAGPRVDTNDPAVNYHIDFARFGDDVLVQISYFIWFAGGDNVAEALPIDGMVWRVTLDRNARPLVYESMHASGRDHRWYPVQDLVRRQSGEFWQQTPFFPSDKPAPQQAALRIGANSHLLRKVVSQGEVAAKQPRQYSLRRYENLYFLPLPEGGSRSLFDAQGHILGSRSEDPVWLWSSGLADPGVLRQYGHHPTSYIGREHFDDPRLLEKVFEVQGSTVLASGMGADS